MTNTLSNAKRLTLTVTRVNYESESFVVFEGMSARSDRAITVTANTTVKEGSKVVVDGQFISHPRFGHQFKATTLVAYLPEKKEELIAYFSSGGVPGIGKQLALQIVREFGDKTLSVIEDEPWLLKTIKGIGPDRASAISEVVRKERSYANLLKALESMDIELNQAALIHRNFGVESLEIIKSPWKLREITGITSHTIDCLSAQAPEAKQSDIFADQCEHILHRLLSMGGHTTIPLELLPEAIQKDSKLVTLANQIDQIETLLPERVIRYKAEGQSFVTSQKNLKRDQWISDQIAYRNSQPCHPGFPASADVLGTLISEQKPAYANLCQNPSSLLTGPPGTGKTFLISAFVKTALEHDATLKIKLAAPTAKAADRMEEGIGLRATTIHRLLGSRGPKGWTYNFKNQLNCDIVIIDEISMVDAYLFAALLAAIPANAVLMLAGDGEQLKSVGQGAVLRDLINAKCFHTVTLSEPVRFDARSPITMAAQNALNGEPLTLPQDCESNITESYQVIVNGDQDIPEQLQETLRKMTVGQRLKTRIISPLRNGPSGSRNLNTLVRPLMNPKVSEGRSTKSLGGFNTKDKVIVTRNHHDLNVFNGQTGFITDIHSDETCTVAFGKREVMFNKSNLSLLELAYVTTIHKMQGSEADTIILLLPPDSNGFVSREMLNSGITRARKQIIVIAVKNAFQAAANVSSGDRCYTALSHILNEQIALERVEVSVIS